MANRVHAAMKSMQATGGDRPANRALRVGKRSLQLTHRDDAVLALRHLCKRSMNRRPRVWQSFLPHTGGKDCRAPLSPPLGRRSGLCGWLPGRDAAGEEEADQGQQGEDRERGAQPDQARFFVLFENRVGRPRRNSWGFV